MPIARPSWLLGLTLACAGCGGAGEAPDAQAPDPDATPDTSCGPNTAPLTRRTWNTPTIYSLPTDSAIARGVSFTEDGLTVFFDQSAFKTGFVLRTATRPTTDDPWVIASTGELQSAEDDLDAFVSADGLSVWFSSDRSSFGTEIYRSTRATVLEPWPAPVRQTLLMSPRSESGFAIVPSQTLAAFSSDRDDGDNRIERDLYLISRASADDPWGAPRVVDGLETGEHETGPALSSDGLELYYGVSRMGEPLILCVAIRDSVDEPFLEAAPVTEINALGSVASPWISVDGNTLFISRYDLAANRWDVYSATR